MSVCLCVFLLVTLECVKPARISCEVDEVNSEHLTHAWLALNTKKSFGQHSQHLTRNV